MLQYDKFSIQHSTSLEVKLTSLLLFLQKCLKEEETFSQVLLFVILLTASANSCGKSQMMMKLAA